MCHPAIPLAIMAVSAVTKASGEYQQSLAAQRAARYNQQVANLQAQDALDRGDLEQQRVGVKQAQLRGEQRARMGANGLDLSFGTPEAVLEQTDYYGLEDQRRVANNARREAAGYSQRATLYGYEADNISPQFNAFNSLLGSASNVASKWYSYKG